LLAKLKVLLPQARFNFQYLKGSFLCKFEHGARVVQVEISLLLRNRQVLVEVEVLEPIVKPIFLSSVEKSSKSR
jgi:hypothetical protein